MRPTRSLAGVLFILPALLVLLTTPSSTAPARDRASENEAKESFTLAVLRRDAIAIPFATYDGKRWKNSWPKPESRVTAPIVLADVPKRWWTGRDPILKWTLWPIEQSDGADGPVGAEGAAGGARPAAKTLETIGPTWFPAHCHQSLGLRTTFSTREVVPPPHVQPYPKAGLAVAGDAVISPIEIIDIASSPLVEPLARTLVKSVYDEETRLVKNYVRAGVGWSHPYNDEERKETPFRIEAMYKVARGLGDRDVYYYEGLKHYAVREPAKKNSSDPKTQSQAQPQPQSQSNSQQIARTAGASQNLQSAASTPASQNSQKLPSSPQAATVPAAAAANAGNAASGVSGVSGKGPGQEPCDLVTFVSGWLIGRQDEFLEDKERIKPLQVNVTVTSCDFAAAYIMLPLGAVRVKDKTVWAVQWSGWTHEHYAVIDVKDEQVSTLLASDGGWCPKR